ncbi:unnamed protein product [Cuscuta campestris]|uniref:Gelsolin-like domain-containing protein n=1 Tax=Cuscuta campestris TaxID=132261 RepID=A0A484MDW3_9ASTE|nr:unnamed protein product [Cuscuta campestris]
MDALSFKKQKTQPGVSVKHTKEGAEISAFWSALGGKENYTSKKAPLEVIIRDPHMFTYSIKKGKFEVKEVYNFSQDDLLTEDVLILDTHAEVFIWVGQLTDLTEKQTAFEVGQKYIEMASSLEGLSPSVPLYKVTEGNEPCFFTAFFSWDPAKAITHGNSFQKKVMLLLGSGHAAGERSEHDGPTQRASALAALNSAFSSSSSSPSKPSSPRPIGVAQGSQRAAAIAALSTVLTAENKQISIKSPSAESSPTAGTENENVLC